MNIIIYHTESFLGSSGRIFFPLFIPSLKSKVRYVMDFVIKTKVWTVTFSVLCYYQLKSTEVEITYYF